MQNALNSHNQEAFMPWQMKVFIAGFIGFCLTGTLASTPQTMPIAIYPCMIFLTAIVVLVIWGIFAIFKHVIFPGSLFVYNSLSENYQHAVREQSHIDAIRIEDENR